jgi:hypothetical protein
MANFPWSLIAFESTAPQEVHMDRATFTPWDNQAEAASRRPAITSRTPVLIFLVVWLFSEVRVEGLSPLQNAIEPGTLRHPKFRQTAKIWKFHHGSQFKGPPSDQPLHTSWSTLSAGLVMAGFGQIGHFDDKQWLVAWRVVKPGLLLLMIILCKKC